MKFSKEFELVPEDCHPYKENVGKCSDSCNLEKLNFPYIVEKYSFLSGSYGAKIDSNTTMEYLMIEELYNNGPFVVSLFPDHDFMYYEKGIYKAKKSTEWVKLGISPPHWRKVGHSALLVGWGVDDKSGDKYWLIQNSWGDNWGEDGYFKILRGRDELHIESMGEIATPGLKKVNSHSFTKINKLKMR